MTSGLGGPKETTQVGSASPQSSAVKKHARKPAKRAAAKPQHILRKGSEGELTLPGSAGTVLYISDFLTKTEADELLSKTVNAQSWARAPISFFGKSVLQPRDIAFFGTKMYSYSDERRFPTAWDGDQPASGALKALGRRIEEKLQLPKDWFNVILANKYSNGQDFMGWHSDNERSLGDAPIIASVSVGAERRFLIRKKEGNDDSPPEKIEYTLRHGSMLVMSGRMQKTYQHSLPRVALSRCNKQRLNFTYRHVFDDSDHSKM